MNRTLINRLKQMSDGELSELLAAADGEWSQRAEHRRHARSFVYSTYMSDRVRGRRLAPRLALAA